MNTPEQQIVNAALEAKADERAKLRADYALAVDRVEAILSGRSAAQLKALYREARRHELTAATEDDKAVHSETRRWVTQALLRTLPRHEVVAFEDAERESNQAHPVALAYVVRRTYLDDRPHEDVETFEIEPDFLDGRLNYTNAYTNALARAKEVRKEQGSEGYAVIDTIKSNGQRHEG